MASRAPLGTRLGPRQWMAIDAAVSVAMLAVLAGYAVLAHPRRSGGAHTLALFLLAPPASLPLAYGAAAPTLPACANDRFAKRYPSSVCRSRGNCTTSWRTR